MFVVVEVIVDVWVVDGPFPIFEKSFKFFLTSFEVVIPIFSEFLSILKPSCI